MTPKILVWPSDLGGCGYYRQIFPADALAAQGVDVRWDTTGPMIFWDRPWSTPAPPLDYKVLGLGKPDADVIVMGRPARRQMFEVLEHLQGMGVKVVVDIDDDFSCIPPQNVAAEMFAPHLMPHHNSEWIARCAAAADWVTVTTPALARRYGAHGRVSVLPNLVPERYLGIEVAHEEGLLVGWAGTVATHPYDLEVTGGAVQRALAASPGARFGVIGTGEGVAGRLGCQVSRVTGWVDFVDYPDAVAALDVGIVPLNDSSFNRAKSALKVCEMAALGVPVVASPTPDNSRMRQLGVGVLADSPKQWKTQLVRLLTDADHRAEMSATGREVMSRHTYEGNAGRWLDVWSFERAKVA